MSVCESGDIMEECVCMCMHVSMCGCLEESKGEVYSL